MEIATLRVQQYTVAIWGADAAPVGIGRHSDRILRGEHCGVGVETTHRTIGFSQHA